MHAPRDGLTSPVPRLKDDIEALMSLNNFKLPPLRVVGSVQVVQVFYGFGDASGKQFGATLSKNYNCRVASLGQAWGLVEYDSGLGSGQPRKRRKAQTTRS
jgi:hypothetical protein